MNLAVGIVGFPNAGKSTLFNALLARQIASTAAYPFCTIEPNIGVVEVADERLQKLAQIDKPKKIVPAIVKFVDIAGLVKGAHKGEGLGNKFLSHIREVDVICFVLRAFTDENVDKAGAIDPKTDLNNLKTELILKDLETIEKMKNEKGKNKNDKEKIKKDNLIQKLITAFNQGKMAKDIELDEEEKELIKPFNLLTYKPYFIVLNINENDLNNIDKFITDYKDWTVVPISAKIEAELGSLSKEEKIEYLKTLGLEKSGLERLIKLAYEHLNLISFLTSGPEESRAWTISKGMTAPEAAGVIHTDFQKGFIKAKVCSFVDYFQYQGWVEAGKKGKVRFEGKDYLMNDGDVVEFFFN